MRIGIGNDHTAVSMKQEIQQYLILKGYEVVNFGTDSTDRFDAQIAGYQVAKAVAEGMVDGGILICGTGVGISLAANKVHGIRAVVCSEPYTALKAKQDNNANIIAFGSRVVGIEMAKMIVDEWLNGEFLGGRYQQRNDMIKEIEETQHLQAAEGEVRQ